MQLPSRLDTKTAQPASLKVEMMRPIKPGSSIWYIACVRMSTWDGSTVMCGWLWYQPTTRVSVPVSLEKRSAFAEQRAICSGLASTRSCTDGAAPLTSIRTSPVGTLIMKT